MSQYKVTSNSGPATVDSDPGDRSLWFLCTLKNLTSQTTIMQMYLQLLREALERKHNSQIFLNLKKILAVTFNVDDKDPANLSKSEWLQLEFAMASSVRINNNLPNLPDGYDVMISSTDRRHRLRVIMPNPGEPNNIALMIRYDGLMCFKTYKTPNSEFSVFDPRV